MSDLVKRLRELGEIADNDLGAAIDIADLSADRIEQLETALTEKERTIVSLREGLSSFLDEDPSRASSFLADRPAGEFADETSEYLAELEARAETLEAALHKAQEALGDLERAGTLISRYGAQTGPQWIGFGSSLVSARAAHAEIEKVLK